MKPVDVMHFVSMDVKCHSNYYSYLYYHMYCNTMYQSDPTGDTKNEGPAPKREKTLLLYTENHCWPGNGKQQPLDSNLCKTNKPKKSFVSVAGRKSDDLSLLDHQD